MRTLLKSTLLHPSQPVVSRERDQNWDFKSSLEKDALSTKLDQLTNSYQPERRIVATIGRGDLAEQDARENNTAGKLCYQLPVRLLDLIRRNCRAKYSDSRNYQRLFQTRHWIHL